MRFQTVKLRAVKAPLGAKSSENPISGPLGFGLTDATSKAGRSWANRLAATKVRARPRFMPLNTFSGFDSLIVSDDVLIPCASDFCFLRSLPTNRGCFLEVRPYLSQTPL